MKRLSPRVACSNGICQTQSPSLRIYVKEFMTGFVPHGHPGIPEPMLNDLRELVDWWRARRAALQHAQEASRKMERGTLDVAQRWIEAIRRQAALDGTTMTQVVHQAFQAVFAEKEA